ncbi:hypothetical protein XENOCAPTIV_011204, partial [Xenoophorus captivus]
FLRLRRSQTDFILLARISISQLHLPSSSPWSSIILPFKSHHSAYRALLPPCDQTEEHTPPEDRERGPYNGNVLVPFSCGSFYWNFFWTQPAGHLSPGREMAGNLRCLIPLRDMAVLRGSCSRAQQRGVGLPVGKQSQYGLDRAGREPLMCYRSGTLLIQDLQEPKCSLRLNLFQEM